MLLLNKRIVFFTITLLILAAFVYSIGQVIAPFAVALLLAYFMSPGVAKLQNYKIFSIPISRSMATLIVIFIAILAITLFSLIVIPLFYQQIAWVVNAAINHKSDLSQITIKLVEKYPVSHSLLSKFELSFNKMSSGILSSFGNFLSNLLQSGMAAVNLITMVFVTPIVLYYTLADWPKFVSSVDSLIPRKMLPRYREIKKDIDHILSSYIRGQTLVCLIMGTYYAIALTVLGSESGLALGFIAGVLTFIPYAGCLFSVFLSSLMIAVQYGEFSKVLGVVAIFGVGQFLEGNFIVPKLVGAQLKLHPVWVIFGLLAGGTLFGFIGVLTALPLTAVIGVFIRYFLKDYKNSSIYRT